MLKIKNKKLNDNTRFNLVLVFFIILSIFSIKNSSLNTKPPSLEQKFKNQIVLFENNKAILNIDANSIIPIYWQDSIIYEQKEINETSHLMVFDLKSKKINPIYQNQVGKKIGDIKIIDNILYFSIYKENSKESLFSIDLYSSNLEPIKINEAIDQKIIQNNQNYFLIENYSNSKKCFEIDIKNRKIGQNIDCHNINFGQSNLQSFLDQKLPKNFKLMKFD